MRAEGQRTVARIELDGSPFQSGWPLSGASTAASALPPRERTAHSKDEHHRGSGGGWLAPIQLTPQAVPVNWLREVLDARHADGFGFLVVVIAVLFALSSMMYACATIPGSLP